MKLKSIGSFQVNPIGIGTWLMGSGLYPDKTHYAVYGNEEKEIQAIQHSLLLGQNHIDTAQIYGNGHTEEIVGNAITAVDRHSLFIASKLWKSHLKRTSVIPAIREMLGRLHIEYLDLVYIHAWWEEYEPIAETIRGVQDAQSEKLIRGIGVSNVTLEQLERAQSIVPLTAVQNYYSLSNRSKTSTEMLAFCKKNSIAFIAAKPLERGTLFTPEMLNKIQPICQKYNKTPSQIALSWLLNQDNVHVIPKAIEKKHIEENLEALFILSEEDKTYLTKVGSL